MINVEKLKKHVVMTFGPSEHDMLTMAPVRITLSEKEARRLADDIRSAIGEKRGASRA